VQGMGLQKEKDRKMAVVARKVSVPLGNVQSADQGLCEYPRMGRLYRGPPHGFVDQPRPNPGAAANSGPEPWAIRFRPRNHDRQSWVRFL